MRTLRNHIGGEWVESSAGDYLELTNPATAEPLCRVPLSTARDVDQAVAAARAAFPAWRAVPPVVRARHLFRLKHVLDQQFDEIAAIITRENGKTLDEARGSLRRGIENVEHACGIPTLMMGRAPGMSTRRRRSTASAPKPWAAPRTTSSCCPTPTSTGR